MSIPTLTATGELPPGIHTATITEVESVFGQASDRSQLLLKGLREAIELFQQANVSKIFIDGSFPLTKKSLMT
jgi:hypothetical protein